jgi:HSP20 family molecular chaperone IbpA
MSDRYFHAKSWNGRHLEIRQITTEERATIIRDAVAKEVAQNRESRGYESGHELKDWRQAESEILHPLNCGFLVSDHSVELSMDAAGFGKGEIEICVEPRHLTICGMQCAGAPEEAPESAGSKSASHLIIRTLELPLEIAPSQVSAIFKGRMIEIGLPKAYAEQKAAAS